MSVLYNLWAQLLSAGLLWAGSQESRFPNTTVTETPGLPLGLSSLYEALQSSYVNGPDLKSNKKKYINSDFGRHGPSNPRPSFPRMTQELGTSRAVLAFGV